MDLGKAIDLALLLEHVPPLLEACICNEAASLRKLRLVNKEWSRVALLGLRSYTVTLKGGPADTNINGASLLQQTKLQSLEVHLLLSGKCCGISLVGLSHQILAYKILIDLDREDTLMSDNV